MDINDRTTISHVDFLEGNFDRPNRSVGRESAFGAGGRGFQSRPHHTKGVKNGTSSSFAGAHIKGVVLGR